MPAPGAVPRFWRDPALPFLEARSIEDGRSLQYGAHSHDSFSIGLVQGGRSRYRNGPVHELVGAGTLVLMNPGDVHACNPLGEAPWRYLMLHVEADWLAALQRPGEREFQPLAARRSHDPRLVAGLTRLQGVLVDPQATALARESVAVAFFDALLQGLGRTPPTPVLTHEQRRLGRVVDYLEAHCGDAVTLATLSAVADLSPAQLIRIFRQHLGLTPHAYLLDCRVRQARTRLRNGEPLAEVALATGFADQAHLQRTFKRLVAATPGQYRRSTGR